VFGSNYNGCRRYGFGEVVCFLWTLLLSGVEVLSFVIATLARIVGLILP
jgi:hypothetical protein